MPIQEIVRAQVEPPVYSPAPAPRGRSVFASFFRLVIILALLAGAGYGGWRYYQYRSSGVTITASSTPEQLAASQKEELKQLIAKVSKVIILPAGEEPTVATIVDAAKLAAEQTFYQGAQNGDKLLIYAGARKAIIWSDTRNILVNVGPVFFNDDNPAATGTPSGKTATTTGTKAKTPKN